MASKIKPVIFVVIMLLVAGGVFFAADIFKPASPPPETLRPVTDMTPATLPPIERPDPNNPLGALGTSLNNQGTLTEGSTPRQLAGPGSPALPGTDSRADSENGTQPGDTGGDTKNGEPSTLVPSLVAPPEPEGVVTGIEKDGKVIRMTVDDAQKSDSLSRSILGTKSVSDGTVIPSSQDTVIPFSLIQDLARDVVNGYWPQGTHVLAASSGSITTNFALLNTRYGAALAGKYSESARTAGPVESARFGGFDQSRQGVLNYVLMPSMVDGLYQLYAERFIRLINHEAQTRLYMRQGAAQNLNRAEVGEMYGLYARSLRSNAGCLRAFMASQEIRYNTEKFILAEQEATNAHMAYQEQVLTAGGTGNPALQGVERHYRMKVAQRESARQNLAASFRRFTDTRNMDTNDLVFLAKWLNRRSTAQREGMLALATNLETLAARMEREQQRFITQ